MGAAGRSLQVLVAGASWAMCGLALWQGQSSIPAWWTADTAIQHFRQHANGTDTPIDFARLPAVDPRSVAVLVEAMSNDEMMVAQAALAALHRQIDGWRLLATSRSSQLAACAASRLATNRHRLSPSVRKGASGIACRLIHWSCDIDAMDVPRFHSDCMTLLTDKGEPPRS
jgi:hypothetical protein